MTLILRSSQSHSDRHTSSSRQKQNDVAILALKFKLQLRSLKFSEQLLHLVSVVQNARENLEVEACDIFP